MNRIEFLRHRVPECAYHYYIETDGGDSLVTDTEFDAMCLELAALSPDEPCLHVPGWGAYQHIPSAPTVVTGSKLGHQYDGWVRCEGRMCDYGAFAKSPYYCHRCK